jgi:EcoRII C terminal
VKGGSLTTYFTGVAVKRLSAVEANPDKSNQHELNGIQDLKRILGESRQKEIPAQFIYLGLEEDDTATAEGFVTWYDARDKHPTRSEYRLYFAGNAAMEAAAEGDLIFVCRRPDGSALLIVTRQGSTAENQVVWLFSIPALPSGVGLQVIDVASADEAKAGLIGDMILDQLGIEAEPEGAEELLPAILQKFGPTFPTTRQFSAFARETLKDVSALEQPDQALMAWMDREESLFRALERHIITERLNVGFAADVDAFIEFSLTVQNRRKSRVGYALENHLEQTFVDSRVSFSRNKTTERNSRPDFIFPGVAEYQDQAFPADRLSVLGVKSTCKDRWRQVLAEADRIPRKHLFTLEPGISANQTSEMWARELQLVLPVALHASYSTEQQSRLMSLREFIGYVKGKL